MCLLKQKHETFHKLIFAFFAVLMSSQFFGCAKVFDESFIIATSKISITLPPRPDPPGGGVKIGTGTILTGNIGSKMEFFSGVKALNRHHESASQDQEGQMVRAANGYFYVIETMTAGNLGFTTWVVKQSTDNGATWTTIDSYQYSLGYSSSPLKILADASSNVYVAGLAQISTEFNRSVHVVRKYTQATQTWTTLEAFLTTEDASSHINSFVLDSSNNLYYSGWTWDWSMGLGTLRAVLRKGSNFGAAWSTVNATSGLCGACNNFMIHKLVVDVDGNLYVAGNAIQNGVSYNWYVRSSNDQGANWITKSFTTNP